MVSVVIASFCLLCYQNMITYSALPILLLHSHIVLPIAVTESNLKNAISQGASVAQSPQEVAERSNITFTMLPASQHVKDVYTGAKGIVHGIKKGSYFVDCR